MELSSVREVKSYFLGNDEEKTVREFSVGVSAPAKRFPRSISLGVSQGKFGMPTLAVRCFGVRPSKLQRAFVEAISKVSKGELEVQFVGRPSAVIPMSGEKSETQTKCRPLAIGFSIGHFSITAGSVGAFCKRKGENSNLILSNAHILSDCNKGKKADAILQPARYDQGRNPDDVVATLLDNVKLKQKGNLVDAAIAKINDGIEIDLEIGELGRWNGFSSDGVSVGDLLRKRGRTTNFTYGIVSAIELDNLTVQYGDDLGVLSFDRQIEVIPDTSQGSTSYLEGGDSGSVSINSDGQGVGLNFAGNSVQGYCNDMREVVRLLKLQSVK